MQKPLSFLWERRERFNPCLCAMPPRQNRPGIVSDNVVSKRNSFIRHASPETLPVLHRPFSHPCLVGNELITGANNTLDGASLQNYSSGYQYCIVGTIPPIDVIDMENV